jgi:hypothetical protein
MGPRLGIIFEFVPFILVKYLCGASMLYSFWSPRLNALNFNATILSWSTRTTWIPFERFAVTKVYSKYLGMLSRFTGSLRGGMKVGNIVEINLEFARSSLCLIRFSSDGQDGPAPREVDGYACIVLVDESCTPIDNPLSNMTLSVIRSTSTSHTYSLTVLRSSDIHAWD